MAFLGVAHYQLQEPDQLRPNSLLCTPRSGTEIDQESCQSIQASEAEAWRRVPGALGNEKKCLTDGWDPINNHHHHNHSNSTAEHHHGAERSAKLFLDPPCHRIVYMFCAYMGEL